jgi:hypothetical protein
MPNIMRFIVGLVIAGLLISALFIFGLFVLATLAILVPVSYIYMRIKHPHFFHTIKTSKAYTAGHQNYPGASQRQQQDPNVLEGEFKRVDDE